MLEAGADAQAAALARRAARHADPADVPGVATPVDSLCEAGWHEQAAALAVRAADHADTSMMPTLVSSLEQAAAAPEKTVDRW